MNMNTYDDSKKTKICNKKTKINIIDSLEIEGVSDFYVRK